MSRKGRRGVKQRTFLFIYRKKEPRATTSTSRPRSHIKAVQTPYHEDLCLLYLLEERIPTKIVMGLVCWTKEKSTGRPLFKTIFQMISPQFSRLYRRCDRLSSTSIHFHNVFFTFWMDFFHFEIKILLLVKNLIWSYCHVCLIPSNYFSATIWIDKRN